MKKIISIVIAALFVFSLLPLSAVAYPVVTTEIRNAADLAAIANNLNGNYVLRNDIVLTGEWTPVGTAAKPFTGKIDGKGYKITGLSINKSASDCTGLFGAVNGTVTNLKVEGSVIGKNYVGGIAGLMLGGTVSYCSFNGTVLGINSVGGIVGAIIPTNDVALTKCTNFSNIYSNQASGGVVGYVKVSGGKKVTVLLSANIGDVKAAYSWAGGIVGYADVAGSTFSISNSYNNGSVSTQKDAGGLAGMLLFDTAACNGLISYCYNACSVKASGSAGAAVGYYGCDVKGISKYSVIGINEFYNIGVIDGECDGLVATMANAMVTSVSFMKTYNTEAPVTTCGSAEYKGISINRSVLSTQYGNSGISQLGFSTSNWTPYGYAIYPYLQLCYIGYGNNEYNYAVVKITKAPTISGTPVVGNRLTAVTDYDISSIDFQWLRNGIAISGATANSYNVVKADNGCILSVMITGRNSCYGSAVSAAVVIPKVADTPYPPKASVVKTGDTYTLTIQNLEGYEYSVNNNTWSNQTVYTGIAAGATLEIRQRIKATASVSASEPSYPNTIVTGKTVISGELFIMRVYDNGYKDNVTGKTVECGARLETDAYYVMPYNLASFKVQWLINGDLIDGAESKNLNVRGSYVGKKLTAVITGTGAYTGVVVADAVMPVHASSYIVATVAPTCTEYGYTVRRCTACGETYYTDITAPTGHHFGEWKVVKEVTCTEDGEARRYCTCGDYETKVISALGHNYMPLEIKQSTCGEDGYTRQVCSRCGEAIYYSKIPANGNHKYVTTVIAPTCTEQGYTVRKCSVCGTEGEKTNIVPALGHSWGAWTVVTAPTYEKEGLEKRVCSICKEVQTRKIDKLDKPVDPEDPVIPGGDDVEVKTIDGVDYIFGLSEKTPITYFGGNDYKVIRPDGTVKTSGYIGTGDRIVFDNPDGSAFLDLKAVIKGDMDGDGKITATDYIRLRMAVLGTYKPSGANLYAGLINGGTKITVKDYTSVRLHILNIKPIA